MTYMLTARWRSGTTPNGGGARTYPAPSERFWGSVKKSYDGCWEWIGSVDGKGYGYFNVSSPAVDGRRRYSHVGAHRVSYEMHVDHVPDGLYVCHRCDNPRCVRPSHLFLGSNQDNQVDASLKGRSYGGMRHHKRKLTEDQVRAIRKRRDSGERTMALAAEFGVGRDVIYWIWKRKIWRYLPEEKS